MDTATELEQWLRKEAHEKTKHADSRRGYARTPSSDAERKAAHQLAQQMMGRKFPMQTRDEEEKSNKIDERIAAKMDEEAAMLLRFADFTHERTANVDAAVSRIYDALIGETKFVSQTGIHNKEAAGVLTNVFRHYCEGKIRAALVAEEITGGREDADR